MKKKSKPTKRQILERIARGLDLVLEGLAGLHGRLTVLEGQLSKPFSKP